MSSTQIELSADELLVWTPAKVNLYLEVLRKRPDGYHDLETLMVAVTLFDTLRFREESSSNINLHCSNPNVPTGENNLVVRAARLLQQATNCRRGATIQLSKRIPMAAGLAGGSSNAAAALAGLNRLWQLGLANEELAKLGAEVGSDVAFFFHTPVAWCSGRGEIVEPLEIGGDLWFVLVKPPFGLATADVFKALQVPAHPHQGLAIRQAVPAGDLEDVARNLHNRLWPAAEKLSPALALYRTHLERLEPMGLAMSGSGTCLFALCRNCTEASSIAWTLRTSPDLEPGTCVYIVRSCRVG